MERASFDAILDPLVSFLSYVRGEINRENDCHYSRSRRRVCMYKYAVNCFLQLQIIFIFCLMFSVTFNGHITHSTDRQTDGQPAESQSIFPLNKH